jgi:hypothetical protein
MNFTNDVAGWGDYPDSGVAMGALIGQLAGLAYSPNLNDVGHGAAYSPGSISDDARALNFLGFLPDQLLAEIPDSFGQGGQKDLAAGVGAFHPVFKQAVTDFQQVTGCCTADGFIGPVTRAALKARVDAKNAAEPSAPASPVAPAPGSPAAVVAATGMSTGMLAAIALAVVGGGYAIYKYVL